MISRYLLAWLGVLGVAFDLMGGLYLAYDLLGGPRGPLRTIMRAATYAVVFGAFYTAGLFAPFGPIAGVGLGILLGVEFGLRRGETVSLLFAVARGAVFGVAGWALNGARFGLLLGVITAVGLLIVYRLRFSVARDYPSENGTRFRLEVARAQAVRASVTAVAALIAGIGAGAGPGYAIQFAVRLGIVSWVAGVVVGSTTPRVERWADRLPARRLGLVGAVMIFTGLAVQSIQYWVVIFDLSVR
ncbi:MAG: hypothetical protein ACR2MZ_03580 [Candidatus Dormibacter sp.]|uniref:hypothetical protein n=1 Tax=Candidatus Dormibacter sp. TaxID=2973982 RepID=UPI000DB20250|nr:MAG: hypothetical protein DLM66_06835 [Candidatus Dormibacteraeota bacterium]